MGAVGPTSASPTPAPAPTTPAAPAVNVQQITTEIGAIVGLLGVGAYYSGKVAGEGGFEKAPWWDTLLAIGGIVGAVGVGIYVQVTNPSLFSSTPSAGINGMRRPQIPPFAGR